MTSSAMLRLSALLFVLLAALMLDAAAAAAQHSSGWAEPIQRRLEQRQARYGDSAPKFGDSEFLEFSEIAHDHDTPRSLDLYSQAIADARCMAGNDAASLASALALRPNTAAAESALNALEASAKTCGTKAIARTGLARGLLSEGAYLATFPVAPALPSMPDLDRLRQFRQAEFDRNAKRSPLEQSASDLANCLVMSDLSLADRIARSDHGGEEEQALIDAMLENASACFDDDVEISLGRSFLRSFVMESLQRASLDFAR